MAINLDIYIYIGTNITKENILQPDATAAENSKIALTFLSTFAHVCICVSKCGIFQ